PAVAAAAADPAAAAAPPAAARHAGVRSPAQRSAPPMPATARRPARAADPATTIPTYRFLRTLALPGSGAQAGAAVTSWHTIYTSTHSPHRPASTSAKPQPRTVPGPNAAAPTCTSPWPQPKPPPAGRACPRSDRPSGWPAVSADYLKCHRRQSGHRLWAPTGAGAAAATPPSERATGDGKPMSDLHDDVFA